MHEQETQLTEWVDYIYHNTKNKGFKLSEKQKLFQMKNLNYTDFYDLNLNNAIGQFNKKVKNIVDKKLFYFWNRKATIFDVIESVKRNKANEIEQEIFNEVMADFWNRIFFKAIYSSNDNKARSVYFKLKY